MVRARCMLRGIQMWNASLQFYSVLSRILRIMIQQSNSFSFFFYIFH